MKKSMNTKRNRAVGCSAWLDDWRRFTLRIHSAFEGWLRSPSARRRSLQLRIFRNKCRILYLELVQFLRRARIRFGLLACRVKFVSKYGCDWRLCVFDDEIVEYLELVEYVHVAMSSNEKEISHGSVS